VPVVPTAALGGVLIGRDAEMAMLVGLVGEVAGGRGRSVLIEGEPGIGKSALVRAALSTGPLASLLHECRSCYQAGLPPRRSCCWQSSESF
jgi:hypothetical protein